MQRRPHKHRTRHGYVAVTGAVRPCGAPIVGGRLRVTSAWVVNCFMPAYRRASSTWGSHAPAISSEILSDLVPDMRVTAPETGSERELQRRVRTAVAAMLNAQGVPTPYPRDPVTPRPMELPAGPPWYRALLTGWMQ